MMRMWLQLALLLLPAAAPAGERVVIDRVVASVNGTAILASEWEEALRYECFLEGRPPESQTQSERRAVLERLVDQLLIRQQIVEGEFARAGEQQVEERLHELRRGHPAGGGDAEWHAELRRCGLSEEELRRQVAHGIDTLRFIDLRLRPGIYIDQAAVEKYYRETHVPEVRKRGAVAEPLPQVASRIEEVLVQQRITQLFDSWLRDLRDQSEVRLR